MIAFASDSWQPFKGHLLWLLLQPCLSLLHVRRLF